MGAEAVELGVIDARLMQAVTHPVHLAVHHCGAVVHQALQGGDALDKRGPAGIAGDGNAAHPGHPRHPWERVNAAKRKYTMIEHAPFEAGMDIMAGAELRRLGNLVEIANTLPVWERPAYVLERLPQALLSPDLQKSRAMAFRRVIEDKPEQLVQQFIPMFLKGLQNLRPSLATAR